MKRALWVVAVLLAVLVLVLTLPRYEEIPGGMRDRWTRETCYWSSVFPDLCSWGDGLTWRDEFGVMYAPKRPP